MPSGENALVHGTAEMAQSDNSLRWVTAESGIDEHQTTAESGALAQIRNY
jgi:hypothetical protein